MFRPRIIPILLLKNLGLVKSVKFKNYNYIGDPINAVKLFNDLKADELVFLDINASKQNRLIPLEFVKNVGEEANMPFAVGGGIKSVDAIGKIIAAGSEKVVINTYANSNPEFIKLAADQFGSSTIVVSIDVKNNLLMGSKTYTLGGSKMTFRDPIEFAKLVADLGAGEIIINSINHDGLMEGYNYTLIKQVSNSVTIPVVACGGAGSISDLKKVCIKSNANAAAAGSMFVYHGYRRAVLINYPNQKELDKLFYNN